MAVMTALNALVVSAEESASEMYDLEIVVRGEEETDESYIGTSSAFGLLGELSSAESPFQQAALTAKTVETFSADPSTAATSVLVNAPAIRSAGNTLYVDYSIRGQNANAYQYRINGVPGLLTQSNVPLTFVERIDVISGPGLVYEGIAPTESAGGVINFITKRATQDDFISYKTAFSGRSTWSNYLDISRTAGTNKEWGIRFNAGYADGKTGIVSERLTQKSASLNIDRLTEKAYTNLFLGYRDSHSDRAERYFDFSNAALTALPSAPNGSDNYTFEGQAFGMRTWFTAFNHTQKLSERTDVFLNAGYAYNNGYEYLTDTSGRLDVINNAGDFTRTMANEPFAIRNGYAQIGATHRFLTGAVDHTFAVAFDKNWNQKRWGTSATPRGVVTGNLYTGNVALSSRTLNSIAKGKPSRMRYYGWSAVDTMKIDKWTVIVGAHRHLVKSTNTSNVTVGSGSFSPIFAAMYRPNANWSVFGNYAESFDQGAVVGTAYSNVNEMLEPRKTKSAEFGIKYDKNRVHTGLSYFVMKQDTQLEATIDGSSLKRLTNDGQTKYKGVEAVIGGTITPKWNLMGGFLYLDSKYVTSNTAYLRGQAVIGTPKWSSVLTVEYSPNTDWDVWGRMVHTGKAPIYTSAGRELVIPSSVVFDAGVRYRSSIGHTPVTYELTVFNVFDRNYWIPRASYNYAILSNPRTIYASMEVKF